MIMNVDLTGKLIIFMYMYNLVMPSKGNVIVPAQLNPTDKHSHITIVSLRGLFFKKQIIQEVFNFYTCAGKWAVAVKARPRTSVESQKALNHPLRKIGFIASSIVK